MAKTFVGTVSSSSADKTIVVTVNTSKTHPLYRKQYTVSKKFMAHDEKNEAQLGDKVSIVETKPISKRKRFMLKKVVEKATVHHVEETPDVLVKSVTPKASPVKQPTEAVEQKTENRKQKTEQPEVAS